MIKFKNELNNQTVSNFSKPSKKKSHSRDLDRQKDTWGDAASASASLSPLIALESEVWIHSSLY